MVNLRQLFILHMGFNDVKDKEILGVHFIIQNNGYIKPISLNVGWGPTDYGVFLNNIDIDLMEDSWLSGTIWFKDYSWYTIHNKEWNLHQRPAIPAAVKE